MSLIISFPDAQWIQKCQGCRILIILFSLLNLIQASKPGHPSSDKKLSEEAPNILYWENQPCQIYKVIRLDE